MGLFNKAPRPSVPEYHGNIETRHWTATCGNLKWKFEVELHTDNPPSIRYSWVAGERNRYTEKAFVNALRLLHGAYGWRYIEIVDKSELERAAAVSEEELAPWKLYENVHVGDWDPPLFGFGMPMSKG